MSSFGEGGRRERNDLLWSIDVVVFKIFNVSFDLSQLQKLWSNKEKSKPVIKLIDY